MIGKTVSHYRITRQLGAGGMGVVYEAVDTKLDRPVALKFLPPESTRDPDAKARFIHEAKAASSLDHPNICTIYEIDETEDGQLFIAMACYEGETLKERIARGPLPIDEAVDITRQIAEGLAKAHERGIVHRDIKPANIFFTTDGLAKLLDFGLAKLAGQARLTKTGNTVGTAAYLAPEQARGEEVDSRADVWCLGATIYEMVTGRLPFRGDHEQAVIYSIQNEQPEPLTGLRSGIPLELERIVGKCLAKDRAERYTTATDLSVDLRCVQRELAGEITTSPFPGIRAVTGKRSGRWPWVIGLIALVGIVGITAWLVLKPGDGKVDAADMSLAIVEFQDLATPNDPNRSLGLSFLLNTGLVEGSPIRVVSSSLIHDVCRRRFGDSQGPIDQGRALEVARESQATHLLMGAIIPGADGVHLAWQLVDTSSGSSLGGDRIELKDLAPLADEIVAGVLPLLAHIGGVEPIEEPVKVASLISTSPEAYEMFLAGRRAYQNFEIKDAVDALERAVELDSTFALAHFALSRAQFLTRARDEIVQRPAETAWRWRDRLSVKDRLRLEAWRQRLDWRTSEALATYTEMLARWPDDREILVDLVGLYAYQVYRASAARIAAMGLEIYPDDSYFTFLYGACLASLGRFAEALTQSRAFVRLEPDNPNAWDELGVRLQQVAEPDSAKAAFRRALTIQPDFFPSLHGLANSSYCQGDLESAIALIERVLAREDLPRGWQVAERTDLIYGTGLAFLLLEAGRIEEALEVFAVARRYVRGPEELARYLRERSWALVRIGRAREALAAADSLRPFQSQSRYVLPAMADIRVKALVALDSLDTARLVIDEMRQLEDIWGADASNLADLADAKIAMSAGDNRRAGVYLEAMMEEGVPRLCLYELEWREAWIQLHRLAGRLDEAESALLELLDLYAGHYIARYELGQVYEEMGRWEEAAQQYEIFLSGWSQADANLPQVKDAQQRLAALMAGS